MNRRESIRNILIASAGTVMLTSCSERNAIEYLKDGKLLLDRKHLDYIGTIADTFLPLGSLGDKIDSPLDFIMTMLNDCHSPEDINDYAVGFDQYKLLMKESQLKIKKTKSSEVIGIIEESLKASEPQKELVHFVNTTKNLAIRHLKSSQYYMEEYQQYKLIPERYEGCIDV